ncbi:MAG: type IV pilin, partial [Thermoplasmatota archaeon]
MRSLVHIKKGSKSSSLRHILGVSEAVGTVLLLGISITIAGGIALWTANIDEGEEGLYVDLWAEVSGDDLVLTHRGGDDLDGMDTEIMLTAPGSGQIDKWTYFELTGSLDDTWSSGEDLTIDVSDAAIPDTFRVVVTSRMQGGTAIIVLESVLNKAGVLGTLPDLAVTGVEFLEPDGSGANPLYESGTYFIRIHVNNFGADMTSTHLREEAGNKVTNLRIFDSEETIRFSEVLISHYDTSGVEVDPILNPRFGILRNGENMSFTFNWTVGSSLPRSLGLHTLNVKVNPIFEGELNYRNNYVQRKFKVDKELIPLQIHGPDPGIYDIYFSNDAPHSGDEVTVTVVIQNSGDEPVTRDQHVNLIVSTWEPVMRNIDDDLVPDWKMDYMGYYGDHYGVYRSEDNAFPLKNDTVFPTCVKLDIELLPGAYLFFYFKLEARVDVPGGEQLVYAAIDAYQNDEEPQGIHYLDGDYWKDNKDFGIIQVLPRILVVDDDNAITGSNSDMTSSVIESLVGSGVTIDRVYVAQQVSDGPDTRDAPAFSYNQAEIPAPAMEDFDIVIWVTGYDEDPLTNTPKATPTSPGGNIQEMMEYMDANKYLLIIGTSPFDHFANYFIEGNTQSYIIPAPQTTIDASVFLYDYLGIKKITTDLELPTGQGQYLYGMDTDADGLTPSPGAGEDYLIELLEQDPFNDGMTFFLVRDEVESGAAGLETPVGVMTTFVEKDLPIPRYNYIRSFSTPDPDLHDAQYRAAVMAWNVTEIKYLNEKIDLFANVLRWFDWEVQVGRDLAVTRMNLYIITEAAEGVWENVPVDEGTSPKYLDTVLLEAYIRNNGPDLESTSLMFYVTGPDGIELPITPNIPDPRTGLENEEYDNPSDISGLVGQGGEVVIYKLWLAVGVGTYTFRVVVDPFHLVSEINEENNDISYSTSTVTSFVTKNNILVVDDDMSDDNFASDVDTQAHKAERLIDYSLSGSGIPPSSAVVEALNDLGYEYDLHTVENVYAGIAWDYSSDLSILDLKRFNSVIWVTGDAGPADPTGRETFTDQDLIGLKKYLDGDYPEAKYLSVDHHENLMMVGSAIISDLMTEPDYNIDYMSDGVLRSFTLGEFLEMYMGIEAVLPTAGMADGLYGPQEGEFIDDIYLGVVFSGDDIIDPFMYESFTQVAPVEGYYEPRDGMYVEDGFGGYRVVSHQYDLRDETRKFNFVMESWQVNHASFDSEEGPLQEILFLPLHWFNTPDWRPDLVGRYCKMSVDEENPVIGSSYLVQAEIANLGGVAGGGTVRFMDGSILIKSENVYLEPDRTTTLEAIWKPNFAGDRSISLWIDLYDDYDEVFDVSNNRPSITKSIFIFWDDMESGDENWEHDSTKLLINGESPLDYLGEPTDTNIDSTWEMIDGFHLNSEVDNPTVEGIFHSSPNSYYMYEPDQGNLERKPLDLVLVLDTSGSMDNDGYDPVIGDFQPIGNMKAAAINVINQMRPNDRLMIMIYLSGGGAGYYPLAYMDDVNRETYKGYVSNLKAYNYAPLWDAIGYSVSILNTNKRAEAFPAIISMTDGDDFGSDGYEDGSTRYCPGSEPGTSWKTSTWGRLAGLKFGDPAATFANQDLTLGHDVLRTFEYDLLYEKYWEDLDIESRLGILYSPVPVYNIGLGVV